MSVILSLSVLMLCSYIPIASAEDEKQLREEPPHFFHIRLQQHLTCRKAVSKCDSCVMSTKECTQNDHRQAAISLVRELDRCQAELAELRYGLPDWCLVNEDGFFVDPDTPVPAELCNNMDMKKCADRWYSETKINMEGNLAGKLNEERRMKHKLAEGAMMYANLQAEIDRKQKEIEEFPVRLEQYKVEKQQHLLEQAKVHLSNLEEHETIFADEVFTELENVKEDNRNLETHIAKHDLLTAYDLNRKERRRTTERIPGILDTIDSIQNRISSKRKQTDAVLDEIKNISRRTASLQRKSSNFVYELTHSKQVAGDVVKMDKELLHMYSALKKESEILDEANLKATFSKLRLVGAMRRLVWEISSKQSALGCDVDLRVDL